MGASNPAADTVELSSELDVDQNYTGNDMEFNETKFSKDFPYRIVHTMRVVLID